jgi:hypothetical protein
LQTELADSAEDGLIKEISGTLHRLDMHEYAGQQKIFCPLLGPSGDNDIT